MSRKKKKKKYHGFWVFIRIQILLILLAVGAIAYYFLGGYGEQVASMHEEAVAFVKGSSQNTFKASQTSIVYDVNGSQIATLKGEKDVYYLTYEQLPANVTAAIISIEDKKFYQHGGIDYKAIIRAGWAMIRNGEVTQGGSTITQQLARTVFLSNDKTWQRKMEEIFIATELEKKYSKNEILEFYLNNIYFGNGYYGIQAASLGYFGTDVSQLSLSQTAYLCAIPNNPTLYDPLTNSDNTIKRRDRILENMRKDGKISASAYKEAKQESVTLCEVTTQKKYDYVETYTYYCATRALMEQQGFVFSDEFASEEEQQTYEEAYKEMYAACEQSLYTGGYRIYTSIDLNLEEELQSAVDNNLSEFTDVNEEGIYLLQSSAVCIDNETGYVKAIVGGRSQDYNGHMLNRAYQSFRQPGSAIKPLLVYTPALERDYTPDSIVTDQPIEDGPVNSNGTYLGDVTLRYAVEKSINTVAWKLLEELTPATGLAYLKNMNFAKIDANDERPAAALGGFTTGVSAIEMAAGYATLENDGNYRRPTCIVQILNADGTEVYVSNQEENSVYKTNAARQMTDILKGVLTDGTAAGMGLTTTESAGKTGTTNSNKDGWFVGYTKYYTTSVWVGYDTPAELPGLTGASYPAAIWHDYMQKLHENLPAANLIAPLGEGTATDGEPAGDRQTGEGQTGDAPVDEGQTGDAPVDEGQAGAVQADEAQGE